MARIAYVNGRYLPLDQAGIHIEDRGFQFADGVYEVIALRDGHLSDMRGHLDRLWRSMSELRIAPPVSRGVMISHLREMVRRNRLRNGLLYMQVTRGQAPRDFKFPGDAPGSLIMTLRPADLNHKKLMQTGVRAVTVPDQRWARRDIKTVALLPQVLAKQAAADKGAYEAWMIDANGMVTEGASSNAWIVTKSGALVTRNATHDILKGVTRNAMLAFIASKGLRLEERPFTPAESYEAAEAFMTGAGALLLPIVQIDEHLIGDGKPGPIACDLRRAYEAYARAPEEEQIEWTA